MDADKLAEAIAYGRDRGGSGLVVRGGRVVGQWGNQRQQYDLKSTTKSFGSVLLGLAIKDKHATLETKLASKLRAELSSQEPPERAATWVPRLTVRQVATHSGGFGKVGGLDPMLFAPGTGWYYSDAGPNWLADFLTVSYMRDLRTVLRNRILAPLGIAADRVVWRSHRYRPATLRGVARREFGSGISTDVDVMARIGLLLLRDGRWNGRWLLQTSYADQAGAQDPTIGKLPWLDQNPDSCAKPNTHYGLLFWNNAAGYRTTVPRTAYWAAGLGTSFIMVIPSLDIVAARAGPTWPAPDNPCGSASAPFSALLVAAVVSAAP